jgi:hypothetical protein
MLVILMDDRVLPTCQICPNCLLADRAGQPRWRHGQLTCGHAMPKLTENQPEQFECEMGFRVVNVE